MTNKWGVRINWGERGGGVEIFLIFNKQGGQNKWRGGGGISQNSLILVINEKRNINV